MWFGRMQVLACEVGGKTRQAQRVYLSLATSSFRKSRLCIRLARAPPASFARAATTFQG